MHDSIGHSGSPGVLASLCMLDMGIVPFELGVTASQMLAGVRAQLITLPPAERRKSERKFRKAWRKILRQHQRQASNRSPGTDSVRSRRLSLRVIRDLTLMMGDGRTVSRGAMRTRMHVVRAEVLKRVKGA